MCSCPGCCRRWRAGLARTSLPSTQPTAPPFHQILGNQWGDFCDFFHILKLKMRFEGDTDSTLNCWAVCKRFWHSLGCRIVGTLSPLPGTHSLPSPASVELNTHKKHGSAICLASFDSNINYFNSELMSSSSTQPEAPTQAIGSSQPVIY